MHMIMQGFCRQIVMVFDVGLRYSVIDLILNKDIRKKLETWSAEFGSPGAAGGPLKQSRKSN